jgi:hypothetical protein
VTFSQHRKIMQPVLRTVRESPFVHFYLTCGHLITVAEEDLKEKSLAWIECWACEEEADPTAPVM